MNTGREPAMGRIVVSRSTTAADEGGTTVTLKPRTGRARLFSHSAGHKSFQIQLASKEQFWPPDGDPREPQTQFLMHLCARVTETGSDQPGKAVATAPLLFRDLQSYVRMQYRDDRVEVIEQVSLTVAAQSPESYKVVLCAEAEMTHGRLSFTIDVEVSHFHPVVPTIATKARYMEVDQMLVDEDLGESALPSTVGACWLQDNPCLTDSVIQAFWQNEVRLLDLSRTSVTGAGLNALTSGPRISEARFDSSLMNDAGFWNLSSFQGLDTLSCRHTQVTDEALLALSGLKEMNCLILSNTLITGAGFADVRDLPKLSVVDLSGCPISAAALLALLKFNRLRKLSLNGCGLTDADMLTLMPLIERLDYIGLHDNLITDAAFKQVKERLPGVRIHGRPAL